MGRRAKGLGLSRTLESGGGGPDPSVFSMRVTAAGTVRSRLSEPGQVAESMLAKISLVIWASNNGWAESRPVTKGGLSEELAMASIFSACAGEAEAVRRGQSRHAEEGDGEAIILDLKP